MPGLVGNRSSRKRRALPGIAREDSDDELGTDDLPWEWIYNTARSEAPCDNGSTRKRKRPQQPQPQQRIMGARMGSFECRLGDTVLLKAEGSNEAWVGIISNFVEEDEGEKAANFMWFSSEKEIRNKDKKRTDFYENELYITPSWDVNPLAAINGKAHIMSLETFLAMYPQGKVPKKDEKAGKVFICRRGCNTRTATYTDEFVWEDIYRGVGDIDSLGNLVKHGTKATRNRRKANVELPESNYTLDADNVDEDVTLGTPKKARLRDAYGLGSATPSNGRRKSSGGQCLTPSHRKVTVKRQLEFTPLATRVLSPAHVHSSPYQLARTQLHVASVPTSLPCREAEFSLVYSHLEAAITDGTGTCIYISGTPGTGKTATVREVVARLDGAVRSDELDDFIFVEINGMKMTDPHQAYSLLWEALRGQRVSPVQALDLLEREFGQPSPRRVPCVVLMDELDQLVTRNQSVMYNFFNWPGLRHSRLIVLAVANTMDLPERTLSNKISSRLGLTRITFPGYSHEQLMRIVQSRLEGVPGGMVESDAVQFASRKVAAVSGDARRALDICRRAVELAEADALGTNGGGAPPTPSKRTKGEGPVLLSERPGKSGARGRVTIETVRRAINEATSNPLQQYLRALPFASRLLLVALFVRSQRSGLAESTFGHVLDEMQRMLKLASESRPLSLLGFLGSKSGRDLHSEPGVSRSRCDIPPACRPGLRSAAVELTGAGIINLEAQRADRPSKIRLAVGDEELRLAFRDDPDIKALGVVL